MKPWYIASRLKSLRGLLERRKGSVALYGTYYLLFIDCRMGIKIL
jgi:hypothetical protein